MKQWIWMGLALAVLGACTNEVEDLKSPCVGDKGSPCDRREVNGEFDPQHG